MKTSSSDQTHLNPKIGSDEWGGKKPTFKYRYSKFCFSMSFSWANNPSISKMAFL